MKKKLLIAIIFLAIFFIASQVARAESCRYTCYPVVCPEGSSGISGDCSQSNYVCCAGTPTNYNTGSSASTSGSTSTSTSGGGNLNASFDNPIGWSSIEQVMNSLMGYLKGVAGTIAVIFIIIGGIMYMFAGANKDMAEKGKHTLTYAIAGLAIVIAAPTFLREIKTILGGDTSGIGGLSLIEIAGNVLRLLLSIVGMLAIIMMVIGGIWMFSATGNEKQFETGKSVVTYAIIGLAIAIGSLVIAQQVANLVAG
jgi:type IV secretory pathway VirB2 component (pilin)